MPTILDELVVKIGLDSSNFSDQAARTQVALGKTGAIARRESRSLEENLVKTQDATIKRLQQVEHVGRQASEQFKTMSNHVLGLLGTLAGAYSLTQFVKGIVDSDAAVGRLSKMLGISTEELSTWQGAAELVGGSAEDVNQSFLSLTQNFEHLDAAGQSSLVPPFRAMGIALTDSNNKLRSFRDLMGDLAEFANKHPGPKTTYWLTQIGMTPGMITLLMQGREELEKTLAASEKAGVTRQADADASRALTRSLVEVNRVLKRVGADILTEFNPAIVSAVQGMRDWLLANRSWIEGDLIGAIRKGIEVIREFAAGLNEVVQHLGGWKEVAEGILIIWAVSKVAPILAFLTQFTGMVITATTAVGGLGASMAAIAVPAWFTKLLAVLPALSALLLIGPAGGEDKEFSQQKNEEFLRRGGSFLGGMGGASDARLVAVRDKLADDPRLGISRNAAAGLASNLNAESGIRGINEMNNGPGFGWAQWTGPRRKDFESFVGNKGLDPASDTANYEFLVEELRTKYPQILSQLRRGDISANEAASVVARGYIIPPADKILGHMADADRVAKLSASPEPTWGRAHRTPPLDIPTRTPSPDVPTQTPPLAVPTLDPGLNNATRPSVMSNDNSRTSSIETHINGPINVHTAATDADGIARDIGSALQKYAYVPQVNAGLA